MVELLYSKRSTARPNVFTALFQLNLPLFTYFVLCLYMITDIILVFGSIKCSSSDITFSIWNLLQITRISWAFLFLRYDCFQFITIGTFWHGTELFFLHWYTFILGAYFCFLNYFHWLWFLLGILMPVPIKQTLMNLRPYGHLYVHL